MPRAMELDIGSGTGEGEGDGDGLGVGNPPGVASAPSNEAISNVTGQEGEPAASCVKSQVPLSGKFAKMSNRPSTGKSVVNIASPLEVLTIPVPKSCGSPGSGAFAWSSVQMMVAVRESGVPGGLASAGGTWSDV